MKKTYDVIIVGGGMVGAALACALARQHRSVAVIEARAPQPFSQDDPFDLRVSAISRASQHVFEALGVWPLIQKKRSQAYDRMVVWDESDGEIHFDAADIGEPDLGHIIENRVIQTALLEAIASLDEVDLLCPAQVDDLDLQPERVVVTLDSGDQIEASLLVGADGARSQVRERLGIAYSVVRDYDQKAIVCVVRTEQGHDYTAWQRFLNTGPLAFLPLSDAHYSSIVWSADTAVADRIMVMDDEAFCTAIGEAFEFRLGRVDWTSARAAFPLRGTQAAAYVMPRLALVGDAAHTIHPLAGQGVNLGLLDAAALAEVLSGERDPGRYVALRRYERMRRGENTVMMHSMEGFKRLFGSRLPGIGPLRSLGLSMVDRLPLLKRQFMVQALGLSGERPALAKGGSGKQNAL
jgi:2-octaprenylphenol hydroxylase